MSHNLNQLRDSMTSQPHNARALAEESKNPAAARKVDCPPHLSLGQIFVCYDKLLLDSVVCEPESDLKALYWTKLFGNHERALSEADCNWMRKLCLKCAYIFDGPTDALAHLCLEHYEERKAHYTCFRCGQVHEEFYSHKVKFPREFTHISRYASTLEPALQKLYKERDEELTPMFIRVFTNWGDPDPDRPRRPESCREGVVLNCSWPRDAGMTEEEENWLHRSCFACFKTFEDTGDRFLHNISSHKEWFLNDEICPKCLNHIDGVTAPNGDHTLKIQGPFTDVSNKVFANETDSEAVRATVEQFSLLSSN